MPTTLGVKAVTSIDQLCLIMIEGGSLIGTPDTPARLFKTTAEHKIPIIMITQASSEHDICLLINEKDGKRIVAALKTEFRRELDLGSLETISVQPNLAAVAVVGQGMKGTPGIAARTFGILGEHGINIIAIAQGSSELNISFVVARSDLQRAVQLVHDSFELSGKGVS
jgi:aspartate kinase